MISGHGDVATAVDAVRRGASTSSRSRSTRTACSWRCRSALRQTQARGREPRPAPQLSASCELVGKSGDARLRTELARVAAVRRAGARHRRERHRQGGRRAQLHLALAARAGPFVP
jgi:DNA-binding NtrC family response regulator